MNYRHAFHAGGFADVLKHAVLAQWILRLQSKDGAIAVVDAHAGIGRYDLGGAESARTGEWRDGIARLVRVSDEFLDPYLKIVRDSAPAYPGSPRIARALLRPQDRLAAVELHPDDFQALSREFARDRQVALRNEDSYQALKALLPPPERRGLVLIDPPFEAKDEMDRLAMGMEQALKRWPTGGYLIWYPIKDPVPVGRLQERLAKLAGGKVLACDLLVRAPNEASRLNGSGLVLINPPWKMDEALREIMPKLAKLLEQAPGARASVEWLAA